MKRCQRCFEPVSPTCLRCVDIPKEPRWSVVLDAARDFTGLAIFGVLIGLAVFV